MRHIATYDSMDVISDAEADAAMKAAVDLCHQVTKWFNKNHPELLL